MYRALQGRKVGADGSRGPKRASRSPMPSLWLLFLASASLVPAHWGWGTPLGSEHFIEAVAQCGDVIVY